MSGVSDNYSVSVCLFILFCSSYFLPIYLLYHYHHAIIIIFYSTNATLMCIYFILFNSS